MALNADAELQSAKVPQSNKLVQIDWFVILGSLIGVGSVVVLTLVIIIRRKLQSYSTNSSKDLESNSEQQLNTKSFNSSKETGSVNLSEHRPLSINMTENQQSSFNVSVNPENKDSITKENPEIKESNELLHDSPIVYNNLSFDDSDSKFEDRDDLGFEEAYLEPDDQYEKLNDSLFKMMYPNFSMMNMFDGQQATSPLLRQKPSLSIREITNEEELNDTEHNNSENDQSSSSLSSGNPAPSMSKDDDGLSNLQITDSGDRQNPFTDSAKLEPNSDSKDDFVQPSFFQIHKYLPMDEELNENCSNGTVDSDNDSSKDTPKSTSSSSSGMDSSTTCSSGHDLNNEKPTKVEPGTETDSGYKKTIPDKLSHIKAPVGNEKADNMDENVSDLDSLFLEMKSVAPLSNIDLLVTAATAVATVDANTPAPDTAEMEMNKEKMIEHAKTLQQDINTFLDKTTNIQQTAYPDTEDEGVEEVVGEDIGAQSQQTGSWMQPFPGDSVQPQLQQQPQPSQIQSLNQLAASPTPVVRSAGDDIHQDELIQQHHQNQLGAEPSSEMTSSSMSWPVQQPDLSQLQSSDGNDHVNTNVATTTNSDNSAPSQTQASSDDISVPAATPTPNYFSMDNLRRLSEPKSTRLLTDSNNDFCFNLPSCGAAGNPFTNRSVINMTSAEAGSTARVHKNHNNTTSTPSNSVSLASSSTTETKHNTRPSSVDDDTNSLSTNSPITVNSVKHVRGINVSKTVSLFENAANSNLKPGTSSDKSSLNKKH